MSSSIGTITTHLRLTPHTNTHNLLFNKLLYIKRVYTTCCRQPQNVCTPILYKIIY